MPTDLDQAAKQLNALAKRNRWPLIADTPALARIVRAFAEYPSLKNVPVPPVIGAPTTLGYRQRAKYGISRRRRRMFPPQF